MQQWISDVSAKALALLVLAVVACGGSASRTSGSPTRGATSAPAGSSPLARLSGTNGNLRIYPIKMDFDDQTPAAGQFGQGVRTYRVNVIFENHGDQPVGLQEGSSGLFVTDHGQKRHVGFQLTSSDPYTYSNVLVEQTLPAHYQGDGEYKRIVPPGFSDFLPLIFGVAVTAHPPFKFFLVTDAGQVPVPVQPAPTGPQIPASVLTTAGQPLKIGSLTATLGQVGPSVAPTERNAGQVAQSSAAMFILADHPQLTTYPWMKASFSITNSGGQNDYAAFSAYLVTSAGILHPEELSSFLNCCTVAPAGTKTVPSLWALQAGETSGPAYVVLLAVRNDGSSATAVWKAK